MGGRLLVRGCCARGGAVRARAAALGHGRLPAGAGALGWRACGSAGRGGGREVLAYLAEPKPALGLGLSRKVPGPDPAAHLRFPLAHSCPTRVCPSKLVYCKVPVKFADHFLVCYRRRHFIVDQPAGQTRVAALVRASGQQIHICCGHVWIACLPLPTTPLLPLTPPHHPPSAPRPFPPHPPLSHRSSPPFCPSPLNPTTPFPPHPDRRHVLHLCV